MKTKRIKKVLMCKPLHYSVEYIINPWMKPGSTNESHAMEQWNTLVDVYKNLGIEVKVVDQPPGVPDMVYATDGGIVLGKKVLLSRFWFDERKKEEPYFEKWFEENGYEIIYLPPNTYFEGNGDAFFWHGKLMIGLGFRADEYTCKVVSKLLDIEVIPLQMYDPRFYHLDIGFLPINSETAFYFPKAFDKKSREVLKKEVPNLIEFTKDEVLAFSSNSIVSGKTVIHQKGSPTFKAKLKDLGYNSIETDVSEFIKSGGGIHCLTNILDYEKNILI